MDGSMIHDYVHTYTSYGEQEETTNEVERRKKAEKLKHVCYLPAYGSSSTNLSVFRMIFFCWLVGSFSLDGRRTKLWKQPDLFGRFSNISNQISFILIPFFFLHAKKKVSWMIYKTRCREHHNKKTNEKKSTKISSTSVWHNKKYNIFVRVIFFFRSLFDKLCACCVYVCKFCCSRHCRSKDSFFRDWRICSLFLLFDPVSIRQIVNAMNGIFGEL